MARTGLSKSQVKASRDQLVAEGRYPSVDAVRLALGNTGSKSTIHKYLKELEAEEANPGPRRDDTARALQTMVDQLAEKLHAGFEEALREKDAQIAELQATVAELRARLDGLPEAAASGQPPVRAPRQGAGSAGFGNFSGLLSDPRGGRPEASPFSIVLASDRSSVFDLDKLRPSGLKFQ